MRASLRAVRVVMHLAAAEGAQPERRAGAVGRRGPVGHAAAGHLCPRVLQLYILLQLSLIVWRVVRGAVWEMGGRGTFLSRQVASGYGPVTSPDRGQVFSIGFGYLVDFYDSKLDSIG